MEKKGLAAVVTGERPSLKTNRLGSRRLMYDSTLQKRERCCKSRKVGLESKPRGRQEIQNWLSTPANSTVGTVITRGTTASCQIKPTQIHAAMQQKKYIMRADRHAIQARGLLRVFKVDEYVKPPKKPPRRQQKILLRELTSPIMVLRSQMQGEENS